MVTTAVAPMVRRFEACATTFVFAVFWVFLGMPLIGKIIPVTKIIAASGVPVSVTLGTMWNLPVIWIILDGARSRATYGMRHRKLIFAASDGCELTFLSCSVRILVGILLLPLAPISFAMGMHDSRNRTLADRLCGTVVYMQLAGTPGYCVGCGYCLYGLPEPRCPECGLAFDPKDA
jgi:uncharacterized RDD family membrane protein YckC